MLRRLFTSQAASNTFAFKTETKRLLDLVTNSLYSDKQVFLRELVSNASDAITKARHEMFKASGAFDDGMAIRIKTVNKDDKNILIVEDDGVGMSREELIECLGTIAKSDSAEFSQQNGDIIGKFGVGFYSAFTVANNVNVSSRKRGEQQGHLWKLGEDGQSFTVEECPMEFNGTRVELELRNGEEKFVDVEQIKNLVKKFSGFVNYPIFVNGEAMKPFRLPIWLRDKKDVVESEYNEFYREISGDLEDPQAYLHFSSDAPLSLRSILFLPKSNPEVLGMGRLQPGLKLYHKRVLISSTPNLLPDYLRFVRGAVECDDLPMNVSREMVQDDGRLLERLRIFLVKRVIKWIGELSKSDIVKYNQFATRFGMCLREGACTEPDGKVAEDLVSLVRFKWSGSDSFVSLDEYIAATKDIKCIVYLEGDRSVLLGSPQYEAFKARHPDYPVLFVQEAVDEYMFNKISEYKGLKFNTVDQFLSNDDAHSAAVPDQAMEYIKDVLGGRISKITAAPSSVSMPIYIADSSTGMDRLLRLYKRTTEQQSDNPKYSPDLTILPRHVCVNAEHSLVKAAFRLKQSDPQTARNLIEQMYSNALLAAGIIEDPQRGFLLELNKLLASLLDNNLSEAAKDNVNNSGLADKEPETTQTR